VPAHHQRGGGRVAASDGGDDVQLREVWVGQQADEGVGPPGQLNLPLSPPRDEERAVDGLMVG
jgi:hypothetical protein